MNAVTKLRIVQAVACFYFALACVALVGLLFDQHVASVFRRDPFAGAVLGSADLFCFLASVVFGFMAQERADAIDRQEELETMWDNPLVGPAEDVDFEAMWNKPTGTVVPTEQDPGMDPEEQAYYASRCEVCGDERQAGHKLCTGCLDHFTDVNDGPSFEDDGRMEMSEEMQRAYATHDRDEYAAELRSQVLDDEDAVDQKAIAELAQPSGTLADVDAEIEQMQARFLVHLQERGHCHVQDNSDLPWLQKGGEDLPW